MNLPPHISTSDPGSYAQYTVTVRQPRIIEQVIESSRPGQAAREALLDLAQEIRDGEIRSPFEAGRAPASSFEADEKRAWEEQIAAQQGRKWLDIPWYFSESFFYLKLLTAYGFYCGNEEGEAGARDPFHAQKERELLDPDGGLAMARRVMASVQRMEEEEAQVFHLHSSLWGNRLDLSTFEVDESRRKGVLSRERDSLIIDHTADSRSALARANRIQVLLDNSGPELVCDLLLVDRILSGRTQDGRGRSSIILHAKKAPFFVSDATTGDVLHTIEVMAEDADKRVSAAGSRLREALRSESLAVRDHWFWNSALHFTAIPRELREDLADSDVVLIKGDANYRRILEDRKWETSLSLDKLGAYFPAPFIALRTMKSELVVDIPKERAARLSLTDPRWMVNGKLGLIRFVRDAGRSRP